jgi:pimeloyl-ACP methyl ester carboxylesterase
MTEPGQPCETISGSAFGWGDRTWMKWMSSPYVHAPRSWTEQAYHKLIYFNEAERGGHFAAWEQPQLFAEELRSAFRTLR